MKTKILSIVAVLFSLMHTKAHAADAENVFGVGKITDNLKIGGDDLILTADNMLGFIIGLFYFVAIVFAIYAGFTILTSGWDEEKVKKGKKVLIYVVIGLIVVFLSSQLVRWIIKIFSDTDIVGT